MIVSLHLNHKYVNDNLLKIHPNFCFQQLSSSQPSSRPFSPNFHWLYQSSAADAANSYNPQSHAPDNRNIYVPANPYAPPLDQARLSFYDLPSASHFLSDSADVIDTSVDDISTTNSTMNHCNCGKLLFS